MGVKAMFYAVLWGAGLVLAGAEVACDLIEYQIYLSTGGLLLFMGASYGLAHELQQKL